MAIQIEVTRMMVAKFIWVGASVSLLLLSIGAYLGGSSPWQAMDFYVIWMLILSFPFGAIAAVLLSSIGIDWREFLPGLWLVLFAAGYFQWFVCIPAARRKRLTTLGLTEAAAIKPVQVQASKTSQTIKPAEPSPEPAPVIKPRRTRRKESFAPFDKKGRTPLQRAIDHLN